MAPINVIFLLVPLFSFKVRSYSLVCSILGSMVAYLTTVVVGVPWSPNWSASSWVIRLTLLPPSYSSVVLVFLLTWISCVGNMMGTL